MSTSVRALQPGDLAEFATGEMVDPLIRLANGRVAPGLTATGVNEANEYAGDFANAGAGTKTFRAVAGVAYARVENGTVLLGGPTTLDGALTVTGNAIVQGLLTASTLDVLGNADVGGALTVDGNALVSGLLTASTLAVVGDATVGGNATLNGNTALGNATTDTLTALAQSTWRSATALETALFVDTTTAAQVVRIGSAALPVVTVSANGRLVTFGALGATAVLYTDITNSRVILGGSTPLAGAADDKLSVVGGALHVAGATVETAIGIRHTAAGEPWLIGATAATNPDLIFKESATEIIKFGALGATFQLDVNGDARIDGDLTITGTATLGGLTFTDLSVTDAIDAARAVFGTTTFSGAEELRVVGQTRLEGATEITTGGFIVSGGTTSDVYTANGTNTVLILTGTTQTQTTVGGAGGASALPATPAGYWKLEVGASNFVVPYFLP